MKLSFRRRIFLYFLAVLIAFSAVILWFERRRERMYTSQTLQTELNAYAGVIANYLRKQDSSTVNFESLPRLLALYPEKIRVTLIDTTGKVRFDNSISANHVFDNHANRPEIQEAHRKGVGMNIRFSTSTQSEYLYYATYDSAGYYIRVALPYDYDLQKMWRGDSVFLLFLLLLFLLTGVIMFYMANRIGASITLLNRFLEKAEKGEPSSEPADFPDDELGNIGRKMVDAYREVRDSKIKATVEREKLLQHFHYSKGGIAFFSNDGKLVYANTHFIQHLNFITVEPLQTVEDVLQYPYFQEIADFVRLQTTSKWEEGRQVEYLETKLDSNGRSFLLRAMVFADKSFELTINDISPEEKQRRIKQEMTQSIAHELRTPVTSIRGYLETLREQERIDPEKQRYFIDKAYKQIIRLSDLIRDINLITKTEEASDMFRIEQVDLSALLQQLHTDVTQQLDLHEDRLIINAREHLSVEGNRSLLYSVFRNLVDNAVQYAGERISIHILAYAEDAEYVYFSVYDTGSGVEERHLPRLFERFYRIDEGRSRETGGSGLGLSIVKNAVWFHKGEIACRNRGGGGLEFLFTLKKKLS